MRMNQSKELATSKAAANVHILLNACECAHTTLLMMSSARNISRLLANKHCTYF